jgi:hypothetical protein
VMDRKAQEVFAILPRIRVCRAVETSLCTVLHSKLFNEGLKKNSISWQWGSSLTKMGPRA